MEARAVFDQDRKTATMDDLVPNDALYGAAMDQLLNLPGLSWVKYAPWERHDNYCDKRGRCWFRRETDQSWYLERPDKACNAIACLPHWALRAAALVCKRDSAILLSLAAELEESRNGRGAVHQSTLAVAAGQQNMNLRALLTAEADRAERGDD